MLLTGRLQPGRGRVRLQMQLSRPDGKLLWSNTYDRENKDNFAMQDEITSAIASEMRAGVLADGASPWLAPAARRIRKRTISIFAACSRRTS